MTRSAMRLVMLVAALSAVTSLATLVASPVAAVCGRLTGDDPIPGDAQYVVVGTVAETDARGPDGWLAVRDPDGTATAALEAMGAFDDDFIAPDETDRVFGSVLRASGFDVTCATMPASSHMSLSDEGWAVFLEAFRAAGAA